MAAKGRQIEAEVAPIRYVAAVFGVQDSETAVRWLILMMVLTCDPLAIALRRGCFREAVIPSSIPGRIRAGPATRELIACLAYSVASSIATR